jgi:hypothetical protein
MNEGMMRITRRVFAIALASLLPVMPAAVHAAAATELAGVWQGKLAVDATTSLTVQFTFSKAPNGSYTGVLNSPDNAALKDAPVTGVTWDGTNLKLQVPSLSGSYAGVAKGSTLDGKWTQPGGVLALVLAPYVKPTLTAAASKALAGKWFGAISAAGTTTTITFDIKQEGNDLTGTFAIPEQGLQGVKITQIESANGDVTLRIAQFQGEYKGKLSGEQITGKFKLPSPVMPPDGFPVTMKRGEYKVEATVLKIAPEAFAQLKGKWEAPMELTNPQNGQKMALKLILRFENNAKGEQVAFLDSPVQNANGLVVNTATFEGGKLSVKVGAVGGEFTGTLAGKTLTGEWAQPAVNFRQAAIFTKQ